MHDWQICLGEICSLMDILAQGIGLLGILCSLLSVQQKKENGLCCFR